MTRAAMLGLVASAMFPWASAQADDKPGIQRFPDNRTLDAQFPSVHTYFIEVWFQPNDKAGTFRAKVYDMSTAGDYNRQAWEAFRTETNAPGSKWLSRKIELTTAAGVRTTEREQIMARIKREKDRIEQQVIEPVKLPPLTVGQPQGGEKKGDASTQKLEFDESAQKGANLVEGTKWSGKYTNGARPISDGWPFRIEFLANEQFNSINRDFDKWEGKYKVSGNKITITCSDGTTYDFLRNGDTMTGRGRTEGNFRMQFNLKKQ